jgi:5,10-methylenetetrahydromethanopterin reductase
MAASPPIRDAAGTESPDARHRHRASPRSAGHYHGVFTSARPTARVPLLLGAMGGPLTFRVAGEIADGVYAARSFSPEAFDYLIEHVRRGAERAGRDRRTLELCASLTCAVSEDGESARAAARTKAAFHLPSMPPRLVERHGVAYAEVEPICEAFASALASG